MGEEKFPFPRWEGHKDLENIKKMIRIGCENDPEKILEYAAKVHTEWVYFKDLLLFIQNRLQRYLEGENKGIGLGIDSSREIFEGLMIVPAEDVSFPYDDNENDNENHKENDNLENDNLENFKKKKD